MGSIMFLVQGLSSCTKPTQLFAKYIWLLIDSWYCIAWIGPSYPRSSSYLRNCISTDDTGGRLVVIHIRYVALCYTLLPQIRLSDFQTLLWALTLCDRLSNDKIEIYCLKPTTSHSKNGVKTNTSVLYEQDASSTDFYLFDIFRSYLNRSVAELNCTRSFCQTSLLLRANVCHMKSRLNYPKA